MSLGKSTLNTVPPASFCSRVLGMVSARSSMISSASSSTLTSRTRETGVRKY